MSKIIDIFEGYELSTSDKGILERLQVPVSEDEAKRVEIVRQTTLLDSSQSDDGFDRISSLASRIFSMPYSAITMVDIDRVWYKSLCGIDMNEIPRDFAFDSFTVLSDMPEIFVVGDTLADKRFANNPLVTGHSKVRFYAGTPVVIENVKIGTLCVMDTKPRNAFSLEDKENLLDLGAAVSLLAGERRESSLHLRSERANIVVSMMHNLRTPMTSLNFAASLLSNETATFRARTEEDFPAERKMLSPISNNFQSTFSEINQALSQLNLLVDSTLCLGHAIIKCNSFGVGSNVLRNSQYIDCNLLSHLDDIYQKFAKDNLSCKIQWFVDTTYLSKGKHVSYPDAILLILISSIGHVSLEWKKISVKFTFIISSRNEIEFPEYSDRILEGLFVIKVYPSECVTTANGDDGHRINSTLEYNYSSIDKILKSIGGGCKQGLEHSNDDNGESTPLNSFHAYSRNNNNNHGYHRNNNNTERIQAGSKIVHEFWVPCKIILFDEPAKPKDLQVHLDNATINYGASSTPTIVSNPTTSIIRNEVSIDGVASKIKTPQSRRGSMAIKTNLRVLVIEDTISVQKLLSRWLQKNGCIVTCANNGKIGLDHLKTSQFEIVFVDFLMPVMLGLTTMRLLKDWVANCSSVEPLAKHNGEALIVGMSATALESEQEEGFLYGMHFFMPKPADLQILGLIIAAKRNCATNSDAIDSICASTGTFGDGNESLQVNSSYCSSTGSGKAVDSSNCDPATNPVVTETSKGESTEEDEQVGQTNVMKKTAQWKLFRSFRQYKRIHPDVKN